ncbi:MAG: hypothetical protein K9J82_07150, partial [Methylotenera sp.]|nr:hypothetical protein [Methylotenera sp.]
MTPHAVMPLLLALLLSVSGARANDLDDCNREPAPAPMANAPAPSAAYWLNGHALQWPGLQLQAGERVRLFHAASAGLKIVSGKVTGADGVVDVALADLPLPARLRFIGDGPRFVLAPDVDVKGLLKSQLLLVHETAAGDVTAATGIQMPAALDELYAAAEQVSDLGAHPSPSGTGFAVWAPTAQRVMLCRHARAGGPATAVAPMAFDAASGVWRTQVAGDLTGQAYRYLVDVVTPTHGRVRNLVTDPYSVALTADSRLSVVADLASPRLKPAGWDRLPAPARVKAATDQVIYELHVRDFSISDETVRPAWRGKYLAFTETRSNGMQHLQA